MLGSLMYYGLYPLTQLFIRLSEFWWKRHPLIINGKPVCDGGAHQCCNTGTETSGNPTHIQWKSMEAEGLVESRSFPKMKEVVVEQGIKMDEDRERFKSADLVDPNPESVNECDVVCISEDAKIQTAADESKLTSSSEQETHSSLGIVTETDSGGVCPVMPAGEFSCHLGSYQGASSSTLIQAGSDKYDFVAVQLPSGRFTCENTSELCTRESEAQVSNGSLMYDLSTLLTDNHAQCFTDHTWHQSATTGWNFPVGCGRSEVVYYPLQLPGTSYYHGFQENANYEVMWRVWEDLSKTPSPCTSPHTTCIDPGSKFDFTVMSYNILAQDLLEANSELYAHCSEHVLAWENRLQNILRELQTWQPDIICLQEVQENHFHLQMYPALTEMGYECVYKRRTGNKTDGCAVCYHAKRFTTLSVHLVEYKRHNCELLDRDNVGIVLLLQPTTTNSEGVMFKPICVASTHLLFNPRRGDVKLAQLAILLAEIDSLVWQYKVNGLECEIILCGDFNCLPNMPLYQLIVTGQLYYHGLPNWMVSGQEDLSYKTYHRRLYAPLWPTSLGINDNCQYCDVCEPQHKESGKLQYNHDFLRQLRYCPAACVRPPDLELIPGVTDNTPTPEETLPFPPRHFRNTICHGFNLSSVYGQDISGTEQHAVTTLHSQGATMVDYIFYSTRRGHSRDCNDKDSGLKLLGRLALLSEDDLWLMKGLPNEIFPSDHLSLLAKFQLC